VVTPPQRCTLERNVTSFPTALHTSALNPPSLPPLLARGKVRDNYAVGDDRILMVASDRLRRST
jgi:hypothetical protein